MNYLNHLQNEFSGYLVDAYFFGGAKISEAVKVIGLPQAQRDYPEIAKTSHMYYLVETCAGKSDIVTAIDFDDINDMKKLAKVVRSELETVGEYKEPMTLVPVH